MKDRGLNILIIKSLFGLDKDMLRDSIGYKGNSFDNYTNAELERFVDYSQEYEMY